MALDQQRLQALLEELGKRLTGDWVLIGGALVATWLSSRRTTEDIDLIGVQGTSNERLQLMRAASALGLPIESVNSAADFFLRGIDDWQEQLVPFLVTEHARILRPSATLFLLLKIGRLSEQDLEDCVAMIERARQDNEPIDIQRVLTALAALQSKTDPAHQERQADLRRHLTQP